MKHTKQDEAAADHESGREKVHHHQFLFAFVLSWNVPFHCKNWSDLRVYGEGSTWNQRWSCDMSVLNNSVFLFIAYFTQGRTMATIQVPIREAINMAIDEEMARDEKVFIIGER